MKRSVPAQATLRIRLADVPSSKSLAPTLETAFRRFESPFTEPPPSLDRRRVMLANELRSATTSAIDAVTRSNPAAMAVALEFARHVEGVIQSAIEAETVPAAEKETSYRVQSGNVHTLADCLLALQRCRQQHRPPEWWHGERGALESVNRKLDLLAGWLIRTATDAEAWSSISDEGGAR